MEAVLHVLEAGGHAFALLPLILLRPVRVLLLVAIALVIASIAHLLYFVFPYGPLAALVPHLEKAAASLIAQVTAPPPEAPSDEPSGKLSQGAVIALADGDAATVELLQERHGILARRAPGILRLRRRERLRSERPT